MNKAPAIKACCITRCPNTSSNSNVQFFDFPDPKTRSYQRNKWIQVIRHRNNAKWWAPKAHSVVCSEHFAGGAPTQHSKHRDYAPSVFTSKSGRKEEDVEVRAVTVKQFALEYVTHPALLAPPSALNRTSESRRKAYAAVARRLNITERMVRVWEARFRRYYNKQVQARASGRAAPRWLSAVDARLGPASPAADTSSAGPDTGSADSAATSTASDADTATSEVDAARINQWWRRVRAGGLVEALCGAAEEQGTLCSTALYQLVRRQLRPRAALCDLHALWVGVQRAALEQVVSAGRAGDAPAAAAPPLAARVADLVLLLTDVRAQRLLDDESVVLYEEATALHALWQQVQRHAVEERGGELRLTRRWSRVHRDYCSSGRRASLVVLQRRWHELKLQARRRLAAHWRSPRLARFSRAPSPAPPGAAPGPAPDPGAARVPLPAPIHIAILKRYPHIATVPLRSWRELVRRRLVVTQPLSEELLLDDSADEWDFDQMELEVPTADSPKDGSGSPGDIPGGAADIPDSPAVAPTSLDDAARNYKDEPMTPENAPMSHEDAPKSFEDAPVSHEDAPMSHEDEPMSHEDKPMSPEDAPKSHEDEPISHEDAPKSHEDEPKSLEDKPMSHEDAPKSHEDEPKSHEDEPMSHEDAPKSHEDASTNNEDTPITIPPAALASDSTQPRLPEPPDQKPDLQLLHNISTILPKHEDSDTDTEDNLVIDEGCNKELSEPKPKLIEDTVADTIDTVSPTPDDGDTIQVLLKIDPTAVTTEILFDSDEDDGEPSVEDSNVESILDQTRKDAAFIRNRILFDDDDDLLLDDDDDLAHGGEVTDDGTRKQEVDVTAEVDAHTIDPKLLLQARVVLVRLEHVPASGKLKLPSDGTCAAVKREPPTDDACAAVKRELPTDEASVAVKPEPPTDDTSSDCVPPDDATDFCKRSRSGVAVSLEWAEPEGPGIGGPPADGPPAGGPPAGGPPAGGPDVALRRVLLRDIEQVRRRYRQLLTAQVKPIPAAAAPGDADEPAQAHAHAHADTDEPADAHAQAHADTDEPADAHAQAHADTDEPADAHAQAHADENADDELTDGVLELPNAKQLPTVLSELSVAAAAEQLADAPYCCPARRHRTVNDTRRRIGLPPIQLHTHGAAQACACCCARVCSEAARRALVLQLAALHRDVARIVRSVETNKRDNKKPDEVAKDSSSDSLVEEKDKDFKKPKSKSSCKSSPRGKAKSKRPDVLDKPAVPDTTDASANPPPPDPYDEWLRQKSVNTQYFNFPPPLDTSKKKKKKDITPPPAAAQPLVTQPAVTQPAVPQPAVTQPALIIEPLSAVITNPISQPSVSQPDRPVSILEEYSRSLAGAPPPAQAVQPAPAGNTTIIVALSVPRLRAGDAVDLTVPAGALAGVARAVRAVRARGLLTLAQPAVCGEVIEIEDDPPPGPPPGPAGALLALDGPHAPAAPDPAAACHPPRYADTAAMPDLMEELRAAAVDTEELYAHAAGAARLGAARVRCGAALLRADAARLPRVLRAAARTYLLATDAPLPLARPAYWTLDAYERVARLVPDPAPPPAGDLCQCGHQFQVVTAVCSGAGVRGAARAGARLFALDVLRGRLHALQLRERTMGGRTVYVASASHAAPGDDLYEQVFELDAEGDDPPGEPHAARAADVTGAGAPAPAE